MISLIKRTVLLGAARLTAETRELPFHLAQDVLHAQEILTRSFHFAFGHLSAAAIQRRAGGFLDEEAQLFGLGADQRLDAALLDDGVGLASETRPQEQLGDVTQAARDAVHEILGLSGSEVAPGHHDLGRTRRSERMTGFLQQRELIEGKSVGLEDDRHLRHAERRMAVVASEDDVLHALAAQALGALFAEHPANRVDDVGLAAAVRSDHPVTREGNRNKVRSRKDLKPASSIWRMRKVALVTDGVPSAASSQLDSPSDQDTSARSADTSCGGIATTPPHPECTVEPRAPMRRFRTAFRGVNQKPQDPADGRVAGP